MLSFGGLIKSIEQQLRKACWIWAGLALRYALAFVDDHCSPPFALAAFRFSYIG